MEVFDHQSDWRALSVGHPRAECAANGTTLGHRMRRRCRRAEIGDKHQCRQRSSGDFGNRAEMSGKCVRENCETLHHLRNTFERWRKHSEEAKWQWQKCANFVVEPNASKSQMTNQGNRKGAESGGEKQQHPNWCNCEWKTNGMINGWLKYLEIYIKYFCIFINYWQIPLHLNAR